MTSDLVSSARIQALLDKLAGVGAPEGQPRIKAIVRRIVGDLFATIDEFDIGEDEFWTAVDFLAAAAPEFGLIAAGLGAEHFIDLRLDAADQRSGLDGGTPRTIEGPLYIAGAPLEQGEARLDDGTDKGETLVMHGKVTDKSGRPIAGAVVDVWHANTVGNYSHFDRSQSAFNLRRRIVTDAGGGYRFRTVMPAGYAVPPGGATARLLDHLGRHGRRPAHIHFFVSAPGFRHLTTQINIDGDPDLHDDFAFATRDGLIPPVVRHDDPAEIRAAGLNDAFGEIAFDFTLLPAETAREAGLSARPRATAD